MPFRLSRSARILAVSMVAAAALAACGGGSDPAPVKVASADVTKTMDSSSNTDGSMATLQAVSNGFTFEKGVAELGTAETTTVTIKSAVGQPTFEVKAGANEASGDFSFGSCIFKVTRSTFIGGPLSLGPIPVRLPCVFSLNTANKPADGAEQNSTATLKLGATSGFAPVKVVIAQDGTVRVSGSTAPIGKVETKPGTGAN